MAYMQSSINPSPTIAGEAAGTIAAGAGKAVKFDGNGKVVLCSVAGERAVGILALDTPDSVAAGDTVTIHIKNIILAKAGAAVAKGAELQTDANGKMMTAAATKFIIGEALTAATADGQIIQVQITKGGYKPA